MWRHKQEGNLHGDLKECWEQYGQGGDDEDEACHVWLEEGSVVFHLEHEYYCGDEHYPFERLVC